MPKISGAKQIINPDEKEKICREVLTSLPEWSGKDKSIDVHAGGMPNAPAVGGYRRRNGARIHSSARDQPLRRGDIRYGRQEGVSAPQDRQGNVHGSAELRPPPRDTSTCRSRPSRKAPASNLIPRIPFIRAWASVSLRCFRFGARRYPVRCIYAM